MLCSSILKENAASWEAATTKDPFVRSVADGTVRPEQFNTWLAQDYKFVHGFKDFIVAAVERAPEDEKALFQGGDDALVVWSSTCSILHWSLSRSAPRLLAVTHSVTPPAQDELNWFEGTAKKMKVDLSNVVVHETNQAYIGKMRQWASAKSWVELSCAVWAIEAVYNTAWASALNAPEPYTECANRWGNAEFGEYVKQLETSANRYGVQGNSHDCDRHQ